jgi:hypothetical protein
MLLLVVTVLGWINRAVPQHFPSPFSSPVSPVYCFTGVGNETRTRLEQVPCRAVLRVQREQRRYAVWLRRAMVQVGGHGGGDGAEHRLAALRRGMLQAVS